MKDIGQAIQKAAKGVKPNIARAAKGTTFAKGPLPKGTRGLLSGPKAPKAPRLK